MTPAKLARRAVARKRRLVIGAVVVLVSLATFSAMTILTDQPGFCGSCHEMRPFYDEWAAGKHAGIWCVDCHVGKSLPMRGYSKFLAFKEVVAHFAGDSTFPRPEAPRLPAGTCAACHHGVVAKLKDYSHAFHETQATCQDCHAETGHKVTSQDLDTAGVHNVGNVRLPFTAPVATVGQGDADISGHVGVTCTQCHIMSATGCKACHKAKHKPRGAFQCSTCHPPGRKWVFMHPGSTECDTCHDPSAKHLKLPNRELAPCDDCHRDSGRTWASRHPDTDVCAPCHTPPAAKHFKAPNGTVPECGLCHRNPGKSWASSHPLQSAECKLCHVAPAKHASDACSKCHRVGKTFAFVHPKTGAGHPISQIKCAVCHKPGQKPTCTCHQNGKAPVLKAKGAAGAAGQAQGGLD